VSSATLLLVTGEELGVKGTADDVAKELENAARSSAGTLAWLQEADTGEVLGVNPLQVVTVRSAPGGQPAG
jgi:hypothetical protein